MALLLVVPASGWAQRSWLEVEIRAQEARWAAQQHWTAPRQPAGVATPLVPRRPRPPLGAGFPPAMVKARPAEKRGLSQAILASARQHRLDPLLVRAVMLTESAGQPRALSPRGARGLMQLMPATAARVGVADPDDPVQNINGGTRYLASLLQRYHGNLSLALAAYNAGESAVDQYGGIPPYRETQDYVRRVQATREVLWQLLAQQLTRSGQKD